MLTNLDNIGMRVTIRQKNLIITPPLRVYIESKLLKPIRRLFGKISSSELPILDLEFSRTTLHHNKGKVYKAGATLTIGGRLFRAEVDDEDIRTCCDLLEEELEREILKYKGRRVSLERKGNRRAKKDLRFDKAARLYRRGRIRNEGN